MRRIRSIRIGVAVVSVTVLLAACQPSPAEPSNAPTVASTPTPSPTPTPTPSPTPTAPPPLDELVLTTEGLGTLRIGEQPAVGLPDSMVVFDPDACYFEGSPLPADSPEFGRWVANYVEERPFGVFIDASGVLVRIDVARGIPTDSGIEVGDSIDELIAAHPTSATPAITGFATSVWVIPGDRGQLLVEAMIADLEPYVLGEIVGIRLVGADRPPYTVYGTDNVAGSCA